MTASPSPRPDRVPEPLGNGHPTGRAYTRKLPPPCSGDPPRRCAHEARRREFSIAKAFPRQGTSRPWLAGTDSGPRAECSSPRRRYRRSSGERRSAGRSLGSARTLNTPPRPPLSNPCYRSGRRLPRVPSRGAPRRSAICSRTWGRRSCRRRPRRPASAPLRTPRSCCIR